MAVGLIMVVNGAAPVPGVGQHARNVLMLVVVL